MTSRPRLGILGGGQLARMLAEAAQKLEVEIRVLVESSRDPAAQVVDEFVRGGLNDEGELRRFFETVDLVTFENEFVNCKLLENAARELDLRFSPSLESIRTLQNKLKQKKLLQQLKIRCTKFVEIDGSVASIEGVLKEFNGCAVLKWAELGYDGKGTFFLSAGSSPADLANFIAEAKKNGVQIFAEEKIDFLRELAIQSVHSVRGELIHYPLVISEQDRGVCRVVRGPAKSLGVDTSLEILAKEAMTKIAKTLPIYGTFAAEFFEDREGQLWINELAPRVHNTGHYSLVAAQTSQFENHILGILGEPLRSTETAPYFAMVNLLGPFELKSAKLVDGPNSIDDISAYWYGKSEVRAGRKMGHLAGFAKTAEGLENLLERMRKLEQNWSTKVMEKS